MPSSLLPSSIKKYHLKPVGIAVGILTIIIVGTSIGVYAWAARYEGRIAPSVFIGSVAVGGKTPQVAEQLLQEKTDLLLSKGMDIEIGSTTKHLNFSATNNLVNFDIEEAIESATSLSRSSHPILGSWKLLFSSFKPVTISLPLHIDQQKTQQVINELFPNAEITEQNATFTFTPRLPNGWDIGTTSDVTGSRLNWNQFFGDMQARLNSFSSVPVEISRTNTLPTIREQDIKPLIPQVEAIVTHEPYRLTYEKGEQKKEWVLDPLLLQTALEPVIEGTMTRIALSQEKLTPWLENINTEIKRDPQNAEFEMTGTTVTHFVPGESGVELDQEKTAQALQESMIRGDLSLAIVTEEVSPTVSADSISHLGLNDLLGVGVSTWKGSPTNRIKNIRNGVHLLNNLLIQPGQEFSLVQALVPFSYENGYLPEMVIKRDKIEPELGGGMCQIGTTLFRAAMNAGLTITERRNHSLVVSYYNDPSNGKPGTDATIYEPSPDFKFKNDTQFPILLTTQMNDETTGLTFSFWGTSDGRKGSYSPPTVLRWMPAGETRYIPTPDLAPGKQKCQGAHPGADTTFTYTVTRKDGSQENIEFPSHYRPLPQICLVGTEPELSSTTSEQTPSPVPEPTI